MVVCGATFCVDVANFALKIPNPGIKEGGRPVKEGTTIVVRVPPLLLILILVTVARPGMDDGGFPVSEGIIGFEMEMDSVPVIKL